MERGGITPEGRPSAARRRLDAGVLLLLTPLIWGITFPAGKVALAQLPVPAFMAWSRILGFLVILASVPLLARTGVRWDAVRRTIWAGALLGALLFIGYTLQTTGLARTTATNAGFITGLYVVFTPILALALFRQPAGRAAWAAVGMSVVGLALLSVEGIETLRPRSGDLLVLASAVAWAGHVVAVGRFSTRLPGTGLALNQMAAASLFHLAASFGAGVGMEPSAAASVWPMLFLTGVLGSGVAFTLQVFAQRELTPARAAVILAGESLFAALFAAIWLSERLLVHQWLGAALAVAAMVLSEVGARRRVEERLDPATAV